MNIILLLFLFSIAVFIIFYKFIFLRDNKPLIPEGDCFVSPASWRIISIKKITNESSIRIKKWFFWWIETESIWEFYVWKLPIIQHTISILGYDTIIISQTYHAYESCCIKKYKSLTKTLPLLCDNCDPTY